MTAPWMAPAEWPRLDLAKHHLSRLVLTWTIPYSPRAARHFSGLIDEGVPFLSALIYTRGRVRHYRVESAMISFAQDEPLVVSVQYQVDTGALPEIPKMLQEGAWLVDPLAAVASELPIRVNADFRYPASLGLKTAIDLPYPPPNDGKTFSPYDEIRGVRGLKREFFGGPETEYTFTLERLPDDDILLNLEFTRRAAAIEDVPKQALDFATFYAQRFFPKQPRKRGAAASPEE